MVQKLQEGKPINGNQLLQLDKRLDGMYNVTRQQLKENKSEEKSSSKVSGPSQVATNSYRHNYDRIFKKNELN